MSIQGSVHIIGASSLPEHSLLLQGSTREQTRHAYIYLSISINPSMDAVITVGRR